MSVRIVRMQNGEDVIADVYEMRDDREGPPLAYKLDKPYTVVIQAKHNLFEEPSYDEEPKTMDQIDIEFQPYVPFSKSPHIYLPLPSVTFIYNPIDQVIEKYNELTSSDAEITVVEERSEHVPDGDADGTGRGTESTT